MKVTKFTKEESGEWCYPNGVLADEDIMSCPLYKHHRKGYLWGFIHSFITEDNRRFDAFKVFILL
jgi:hypothetical protein